MKHYINSAPNLWIECIYDERGLIETKIQINPDESGFYCSFTSPTQREDIKDCLLNWLSAYSQSKPLFPPIDIMHLDTTPFCHQTLSVLCMIGFGESLSYQEVAIRCNNPKAYRAVGTACGKNPFPLLIPCHRVLAQGDKIGGFSAGMPIKHELLKFENIFYHA